MENDFLDVNYTIKGNTLTFSSDVFENFTEYYLKTLINKFEKDTNYYMIIDKYHALISHDFTEDSSQYKEFLNFLSSKLKKFKGYEIIKKRNEKTDILNTLDLLKRKDIDFDTKKIYLKEIVECLEKHKDIFLLKDIVNTKVKLFWDNIAFLNNNNKNKEMSDCYKNTFIDPVIQYLNKKQRKSANQCIECGRNVSSQKEGSMRWLNDVGVDIKRKISNYWNFNPDIVVCPICKTVYSCAPLGFYIVGNNALFINSNTSIEAIIRMNNLNFKMNTLVGIENAVYYSIARAFNYLSNVESAKKQANSNIQVVKRVAYKNGTTYQFNIIVPSVLTVLSEREKEFRQLLNKYYMFSQKANKKEPRKIINIYDKTIENILNNRDLYMLLYDILKDALDSSQKVDFLYAVLKVQISNLMKGVTGMERTERINKLEKTTFFLRKCGLEIKGTFADNNEIQESGKLKSYIYKLLTALRINNVSLFMDTAIRIFNDTKKEIPITFINMLNDQNQFKILGYAFVLGLLGQDDVSDKNEFNNKNLTEKGEDENE